MADLEAVLADVSYLMAMEKSKNAPAARASKRITLADPSVRGIMRKYLEKNGELSFDKIFSQQIGYLLFKDYCEHLAEEPVPQMQFFDAIKEFEKLDSDEERIAAAKNIYDTYIMRELLSQSHAFSPKSVDHVQELLTQAQKSKTLPGDAFKPYRNEICNSLRGELFEKFLASEKFTRFCQWKNFELNINLSMNDFSVHRIIGRGGFGEVYGCRKADTGKMYAMKCLDKKRIKMKGGETLALNERIMLSLVSKGQDGCPFIVCMTYAFQTPEKLCFILDLMNGGDLHYHLSQHNVFSEKEVRFYASEVILGLEHMHTRYVVYRDLKPANCLLDENGHVRISDLGLACDFSKKKPHAGVGTHGYMAPEVLQKGVAYDSCADWFSLGCMIYKLLKGHSPFRQHKTKDKHEIDKMTMSTSIDLPDSMSPEMRSLLEGLLQRDVDKRLGCMGRGAEEVKEHVFFHGIDWQQVYQQKYTPPLIPPRGEVNAADAFDIGSFDEEDTKGIKLSEADQELYKNFPLVVSDRWQAEVCETIFDVVNQEADRIEAKKRQKQCSSVTSWGGAMSVDGGDDLVYTNLSTGSGKAGNAGTGGGAKPLVAAVGTDCIVDGDICKLGGPFMQTWQKKYLKLFPNRLELYNKSRDAILDKGVELISMLDIKDINNEFVKMNKAENCIAITLKNDTKLYLTSPDRVVITQWKEEILNGFRLSHQVMANMNRKAHKMYGADDLLHQTVASSSSAGVHDSHHVNTVSTTSGHHVGGHPSQSHGSRGSPGVTASSSMHPIPGVNVPNPGQPTSTSHQYYNAALICSTTNSTATLGGTNEESPLPSSATKGTLGR